jgi:tRNA(Arg) A34 adenosine deaminase TadA
MQNQDKEFLIKALEKAKESAEMGGFPAGAIIVKDGKIIGSGISTGNILKDSTSHGEMASIRDACKNLGSGDLSGAILYDSVQPCLMCFGATMWSGISIIVFACSKEKVSPEYYGGHYHIDDINNDLIRPIEMVQIPELEEESLSLVKEWEKNLSK